MGATADKTVYINMRVELLLNRTLALTVHKSSSCIIIFYGAYWDRQNNGMNEPDQNRIDQPNGCKNAEYTVLSLLKEAQFQRCHEHHH